MSECKATTAAPDEYPPQALEVLSNHRRALFGQGVVMASVYLPRSLEGFELCHPLREEDFEAIHVAIDGQPRQQSWRPVEVQVVREDEGKPLLPADSPWLGSHALWTRSGLRGLEFVKVWEE
ncbi:MAG: hypothetical protein NVS2B9_07030 [Myxococcales bacterium]